MASSSDLSLHHVSRALKSTRVCLLCTVFPFSHVKYYCLFIFDPTQKPVGEADGEFIIKHPTIRIHPTNMMTMFNFHLCGSTLYMFTCDDYDAKSVYTLDLSCVTASVHLESHMAPIDINEADALEESMVDDKIRLKKEPDMTGWKSDVQTVANPDGTCLMVYSGELWANTDTHGNEYQRCDFELYNLLDKSWTVLPDFKPQHFLHSNSDVFLVVCVAKFVSNDLFVIITNRGEFSLDIPEKVWSDYKADGYSGNEFYFTESHVVRGVDGIKVSTLPPLTPMPPYVFTPMKNSSLLPPKITTLVDMLYSDDYELCFCFAQGTVERQTDFKAYITFDLFLINHAKHRRKHLADEKVKDKKEVEEQENENEKVKDKKKVEEHWDIPTTKLNSFGIVIAQQEENLAWFEASALFQIRN